MSTEGYINDLLQSVEARLRQLTEALVQGPGEFRRLGIDTAGAMLSGNGIVALTYSVISLLIAGGVEWLYWTYAASTLRALEAASVTTPRHGFWLALRRVMLNGFGLALFGIVLLGSVAFFDWPPSFAPGVVAFALLVIAVRFTLLIADAIVAPRHHQLRLVNVSSRLAVVSVGVAVAVTFVLAVDSLFSGLLQNSSAPHAATALEILVATLLTTVALATAWAGVRGNARKSVSDGEPPKLPVSFLVVVLILGIFGLWLAGGRVPATLAVDIAFVAFIQSRLRSVVFFFWSDVGPQSSDADDLAKPESAAVTLAVNRGETDLVPSIVLNVMRYAVVLVGIAAALLAASVQVAAMEASGNPAARLGLHLLGVAGLALTVNIAWIALRVSVDRRLRDFQPVDLHGEPGPNARLQTLLPLLRTTGAIVLLVLFVLLALWMLGIQITPLLAGAGVFGLALGFGAQALVRDIISGVFYLVEDVFRVGEYIESGPSTKGTVERITLRTVALRHHNGPLHFVPYGALGTVRNNSRDWVVQKFDLPLPVDVDSEHVRKLVKKVGEAMQADPEIGPKMREALKTKLYRVDPGVKTFRCKFQTAPGHQFDVRAQAFKRIEAAFREAGIQFANGTQTVVVHQAPTIVPAEMGMPDATRPARATSRTLPDIVDLDDRSGAE